MEVAARSMRRLVCEHRAALLRIPVTHSAAAIRAADGDRRANPGTCSELASFAASHAARRRGPIGPDRRVARSMRQDRSGRASAQQ